MLKKLNISIYNNLAEMINYLMETYGSLLTCCYLLEGKYIISYYCKIARTTILDRTIVFQIQTHLNGGKGRVTYLKENVYHQHSLSIVPYQDETK